MALCNTTKFLSPVRLIIRLFYEVPFLTFFTAPETFSSCSGDSDNITDVQISITFKVQHEGLMQIYWQK